MRDKPLPWLRPSLALALAALPACSPSCSPACSPSPSAGDSATRAARSAAGGELTLTFADRTEKFYTGEVQLRDLLDLTLPLLGARRGEPRFDDGDPGPWVRQPLELSAHEELEAELVTLPATDDGVREWQLQLHGPATSGPFLADAERRSLTISFGFDAGGEPLFCVGLLHDEVARTQEAFMRYQSLEAAPVGGSYKIGRTAEDCYWRPITLRAELHATGPGESEDWPGGRTVWEYTYGEIQAPAASGRLADIAPLRAWFDLE